MSSEGEIKVSTELIDAPKEMAGFSDNISMDVIESASRFGLVANLYPSSQSASAGGTSGGTIAAAAAAGSGGSSTPSISEALIGPWLESGSGIVGEATFDIRRNEINVTGMVTI